MNAVTLLIAALLPLVNGRGHGEPFTARVLPMREASDDGMDMPLKAEFPVRVVKNDEPAVL